MKKTLNLALLALLLVGMAAVTLVNDRAGTSASAAKLESSPNVPLAWLNPLRLTPGGAYDNFAGIAASPLNDGFTSSWAQVPIPSETDANVSHVGNSSLNGPLFTEVLAHGDAGQISTNNRAGPSAMAHDNFGQRYSIYWDWPDNSPLCAYLVKTDANGHFLLREQIPGSCSGSIPRKLLSVAVDTNRTAHIIMARDNVPGSLGYWQRLDNGTWTVQAESIPSCAPYDVTVGVTTQGIVFGAWKDCAVSGQGTDIAVGRRVAPGQWLVEDISAPCCDSCPNASSAYLPQLQGDPFGGMRIVWADGRCGNAQTDMYYREWVPGTGWDNQPIVRIAWNSGESYFPDMTVDHSGEAHVVWSDMTSSPVGYYRLFYNHGRGTAFSPVEIPFQAWSANAWQRDPAIDMGNSYIHVAFTSPRFDSQKDNFYSNSQVGPAQPTATPIPTSTPTAPYPNERFKDVGPDQYFYAATLHLNDLGIINGYNTVPPCPWTNTVPCFLPFSTTTRGQMSKIVALAAGFTEPVSGQTFQDVPPSNTFYQFIERLSNRDIIGGYACGGPGEPCVAPTNRPYFRPGNNVTRGQLSKMTTLAFNFTEPVPAGQQSFQDVPPTNTFYLYVERLSNRDIIGGYACGGPGEPCVAPTNRPYFRPNAQVLRGQTVKIIDGALSQPSATSTSIPTETPTETATATETSILPELTPTLTLTALPTVTIDLTATPTETPPGRNTNK
jgi:hypothetical protein